MSDNMARFYPILIIQRIGHILPVLRSYTNDSYATEPIDVVVVIITSSSGLYLSSYHLLVCNADANGKGGDAMIAEEAKRRNQAVRRGLGMVTSSTARVKGSHVDIPY